MPSWSQNVPTGGGFSFGGYGGTGGHAAAYGALRPGMPGGYGGGAGSSGGGQLNPSLLTSGSAQDRARAKQILNTQIMNATGAERQRLIDIGRNAGFAPREGAASGGGIIGSGGYSNAPVAGSTAESRQQAMDNWFGSSFFPPAQSTAAGGGLPPVNTGFYPNQQPKLPPVNQGFYPQQPQQAGLPDVNQGFYPPQQQQQGPSPGYTETPKSQPIANPIGTVPTAPAQPPTQQQQKIRHPEYAAGLPPEELMYVYGITPEQLKAGKPPQQGIRHYDWAAKLSPEQLMYVYGMTPEELKKHKSSGQ